MFGRKKKNTQAEDATDYVDAHGEDYPAEDTAAHDATLGDEEREPLDVAEAQVGIDYGPFDGDSLDYREFDFSDFAKGGLDLGSIMVPVPIEGEVQVEMSENGPQMVHIVTRYGRITPVAFAAPRSGGLWEESVKDIVEGLTKDGLEVQLFEGPWGTEVRGDAGEQGSMRIIGAEGPRWMLRLTLAGPLEHVEELASVGREIVARTFVYRGTNAIPAGQSLPVKLPNAMIDELRRQLEARTQQVQAAAAAEAAQGGQQGQPGQPGQPS